MFVNEGTRGSTLFLNLCLSWNDDDQLNKMKTMGFKPRFFILQNVMSGNTTFFQPWEIHGIGFFLFLKKNSRSMQCKKKKKYVCKLTFVLSLRSATVHRSKIEHYSVWFLEVQNEQMGSLSHRPANGVWSRQGRNLSSCIQAQYSYCYLDR